MTGGEEECHQYWLPWNVLVGVGPNSRVFAMPPCEVQHDQNDGNIARLPQHHPLARETHDGCERCDDENTISTRARGSVAQWSDVGLARYLPAI